MQILRLRASLDSKASWSLLRCLPVLLATIGVVWLASPSVAAGDRIEELYEDDPLGLVAAYKVRTHYSLDEDLWDVWICEVPDGTLQLSPEETVELLQAKIAPYFGWLSGGRYRPSFRVGGVVEVASSLHAKDCNDAVYEAARGVDPQERAEGAMIVVNKPLYQSDASIGFLDSVSPVEIEISHDTFPRNGRSLLLTGASVAAPGSLSNLTNRPTPILTTVAHEMGHAIGFPHSFRFSPYDHPMDVMGGNDAVSLEVGTIAINRYAAGWIDSAEVQVFEKGRARYRLRPPGDGDTQMLVLRSDQSGFITLGARARKGFDSGIPKEGVESYFVDYQACSDSLYKACRPSLTPVQAVVAAGQAVPLNLENDVAHVMEVGGGYTWEGITVRVVERIGDDYIVEVDDGPSPMPIAGDGIDDRVSNVRNDQLYEDDPLGLIAGFNVTTHYGLGEDIWDVWICETPGGIFDISVEKTLELLKAEVVPYFKGISGGRYSPSFRAGGTITAEAFDNWKGCIDPVFEASRQISPEGRAEGVIVVADRITASFGGIGTVSHLSAVEVVLRDTTFPDNYRDVTLSGASVAEEGSLPPGVFLDAPLPILSQVAHEIGHAIGFPHSFRFSPYDHPMDIMGDDDAVPGLQVGTIAINRYAAGWMDPAQVEIHEKGRSRYRLRPPGDGGTQMLVLRSDQSGFVTLGARARKGIDSGIPKEGVESYFVEQQSEECYGSSVYEACFGTSRRTQAIIPPSRAIPLDLQDTVAHVMEVGDGYTWRGLTVTVVERIGDDFVVEVVDQSSPNRFIDDDWNVHERNIETIAGRGITLGCNPPANDRYCPSRSVSRAEMAALLIRALGESPTSSATSVRFTDVPRGGWYVGHVERLAELGVVGRDGEGSLFRPLEPLTRLEMAVWMARSFDSISEVTPTGAFSDVPTDVWYAGAVEGLLEAGITRGCSTDPLSYCPHDHVLRDQMASFLARVLASETD